MIGQCILKMKEMMQNNIQSWSLIGKYWLAKKNFKYGKNSLRVTCTRDNGVEEIKLKHCFLNSTVTLRLAYLIHELETDPVELQNFIEATDQDSKSLNNKSFVLDTNYTKAGMHVLIQDTTKDMTFKRNISNHGGTKWISCNARLKD